MKYFWFFGSLFYIHLTYVYFALILLTTNLHILEIYTKHGLKLKSLVACRIREMYKWKMVKKWQLDEVCLDKLLNTIKAFSILIWDAYSFFTKLWTHRTNNWRFSLFPFPVSLFWVLWGNYTLWKRNNICKNVEWFVVFKFLGRVIYHLEHTIWTSIWKWAVLHYF